MADQVVQIADEVGKFVSNIAVLVTEGVWEGVRDLNPVLTGYSRSNWLVQAGTPDGDTVGTRLGGVDNASAPASMNALRSGGYRMEQGAIYITNNVHYIRHLNSSHAAAGFVEVGILRGITAGLSRIA